MNAKDHNGSDVNKAQNDTDVQFLASACCEGGIDLVDKKMSQNPMERAVIFAPSSRRNIHLKFSIENVHFLFHLPIKFTNSF